MKVYLVVYTTAMFLLLQESSCELYTALVDMEELLETEAVLMNTLEGYISVTEDKLHRLRRHLEEFKKEHEQASEGVQEYLTNPINAYLLTKRLTSNWKEVETLMTDDVGQGNFFSLDKLANSNNLKSKEH